MPRQPEIHYRLKPLDKNGQQLIYLDFVCGKKRIRYSFGQFIGPKDWDSKKERVKKKDTTTNDGKFQLNDLLSSLKTICEKAIIGIPPAPEVLTKMLDDYINQNHNGVDVDKNKPTLFKLINRFIDGEIKNRGREKSINTIKTYITCKNHLEEFQKTENIKLDFEDITLDFYYKYVSFLKLKDIMVNAIGKDISILKVFMGEAIDLQYTTNMQFKHKKFFVTREDAENIYLTENELHKLYKCPMSFKVMEEQRDMFIIGASTGLRLSDYKNIKLDNIVEIDGVLFIKMITKKTKGLVIIPFNPVVVEILKKYADRKNNVPDSVSDQYFNRLLKDACKLAELKETGRLTTRPELKLYQCVSSHSARRSFATNMYLQGFPTIDLMKITGHSSEKTFLKYIKMTKLDTAKRLSAHIKKNWSEKMLRIA